MPGAAPNSTVDEILGILRLSAGSGYIGEPISQLDHALQAAHFARAAGCSEEMILAALLHDMGHLVADANAPQMDDLGVLHHEHIGGAFLSARGFSRTVTELVEGHVQGKRYLVHRDAAYRNRLSEASKGTLQFQGGAMSESEAQEFESDPLFGSKIQLRRFDEVAKRVDFKVEPLDAYLPMLMKHLVEFAADQSGGK